MTALVVVAASLTALGIWWLAPRDPYAAMKREARLVNRERN